MRDRNQQDNTAAGPDVTSGPFNFPDGNVMDTSAIALHEAFSSFQRAGFTEDQALDLVKTLLVLSAEA